MPSRTQVCITVHRIHASSEKSEKDTAVSRGIESLQGSVAYFSKSSPTPVISYRAIPILAVGDYSSLPAQVYDEPVAVLAGMRQPISIGLVPGLM